jgi:Zn finger protein HypA/HybF involved in hydrogenase expression
MHELGITGRLLEVVLERAAAAGATQVSHVHLEIGEESDVAPAALEHYWPEVSRATPAQGARLVFSVAGDPFACRVVAIDVPDPAP